MTRPFRAAQYGLITAGIVALGYCTLVNFERWLFQAKENRRFDEKLFAHSVVPKVSPEPGEVLGLLEIPRLGVSVVVVEGVADDDLRKAAGHVPGTALPGQAGNVCIAAHRDTFFRPLRRIHRSDLLVLNTPQGPSRYRVVSTIVVSPEVIQVLYPTANDRLTLVTCFPFDYMGPAPKRFIVEAGRVQD
jgi:sortase A